MINTLTSFNLHGPFGKYRILTIKNSFKNIIEALVPNIMTTHMQFARLEQSWSNDEYYNLCKLTRKQALVELKESRYSNIDRRMFDKDVNPLFREMIRKRDPILLEYREKFSEIAHKLLNLQTEIFKLQK